MAVIEDRRANPPVKSYTTSLFQGGVQKIGGKIVEECAARDLQNAKHPYTRALIAAAPSLDVRRAELATVTRDPEWLL